jgi:hypothetical protein
MTMQRRFVRVGSIFAAMTIAAAGCGGGHRPRSSRPPRPKLPHALAVQLAAASTDVARKLDAGDTCGALTAARSLQQRTIDAINGGRVPGALQEPLQSSVSDLAGRIRCTPQPVVRPAPPAKGHGHGHEDHGQGHGKHKGDGEGG